MSLRPSGPTRRTATPVAAALVLASFAAVAHAQSPTYEDQVMEIVNQERWTNGQLPPLKRNDLLNASATTHSSNMAVRNFFAHCDLDTGTKPWDRMTAAGYTGWNYAAENIAAGYSTPAAVMIGWMNSAGHKANLLSTSSREIGIGYLMQSGDQSNVRGDSNGDCAADGSPGGPYTRYWTQNFGRRNSIYPVVVNREAFQATEGLVSLYVYGTGWATQMRFRNESGTWSAWLPYTENTTWVLSAGNGTKTVNCEIKNATGSVQANSDQIQLNASADVAVNMTSGSATVESGQTWSYTLTTTNNGGSTANNILLSDALPAGLAYESANKPVTVTGNTVTRTITTLGSGASDVVTITLRASGAAGAKVIPVNALAGEFDPVMANNTDSLPLDVTVSSVGVPGDDPYAGAAVLALAPNLPNPFTTATRLAWTQPASAHVTLTVHDAAGRRIVTVADGRFDAGDHTVLWNGADADAKPVAAGLYFSRLVVDGQVRTGKLLLTR
ncbi:MAG TPA: CAP domain-containing protein [Candidatus Eisenbacteria bacterium]